MITYLEIHFNEISPETSDVLVARLPELGFSGMEETPTGLKAYATAGQVDLSALDAICAEMGINYTNEELKEENWNSSWESNFDPVILPGKIHVRAHFHPTIEGFDHEILITPKMSFGTGHHATTRMMMLGMLELDFMGKEVLDFGTGTGILAILAGRLGASSIDAIAVFVLGRAAWSADRIGAIYDAGQWSAGSGIKSTNASASRAPPGHPGRG